MEEKEQITTYFRRYGSISDTDIGRFLKRTEVKTIAKSDFLLEEGKICKHHFFILNGLTRIFHIDTNGNEKITQFALENWWLTNWGSYKNEQPSRSYIQAIEHTTVLQIEKTQLMMAFHEIPALERIFREITENWLIAVQNRSEFYLNLDSKGRYEKFISAQPAFSQRVPQYMIASYLEITPQHLSVIRNTKS